MKLRHLFAAAALAVTATHLAQAPAPTAEPHTQPNSAHRVSGVVTDTSTTPKRTAVSSTATPDASTVIPVASSPADVQVAATTSVSGPAPVAPAAVIQPNTVNQQPVSAPPPITEFVVQYNDTPAPAELDNRITALNSNPLFADQNKQFSYIQTLDTGHVVIAVQDAAGQRVNHTEDEAAKLIKQLEKADGRIQYVDPGLSVQPAAGPVIKTNDPYAPDMWHLGGTAGAIDAPGAWAILDKRLQAAQNPPPIGGLVGRVAGKLFADLARRPVTVGILDTGYIAHDALPTKIFKGRDFVDNDNDPHDDGTSRTQGQCTNSPTSTEYPAVPYNSQHGLIVEGLMTASRDDGVGTVGVNPAVLGRPQRIDVVHSRFFGRCNANNYGAYLNGLNYLVNYRDKYDQPLDVINMSQGMPISGTCPRSMSDVLKKAVAQNTVVVISAGNDRTRSVKQMFPANCASVAGLTDSVITVGGADMYGKKASFSSTGAAIYAPSGDMGLQGENPSGGLVAPTHPAISGVIPHTSGNEYQRTHGTSYSAAVASGAVTVLRGINRGLSPKQIKSIFVATSQPTQDGGQIRVINLAAAAAQAEQTTAEPAGIPASDTNGSSDKNICDGKSMEAQFARLFGICRREP